MFQPIRCAGCGQVICTAEGKTECGGSGGEGICGVAAFAHDARVDRNAAEGEWRSNAEDEPFPCDDLCAATLASHDRAWAESVLNAVPEALEVIHRDMAWHAPSAPGITACMHLSLTHDEDGSWLNYVVESLGEEYKESALLGSGTLLGRLMDLVESEVVERG